MALKHRIEKLERRMGKPGDNVPVLITCLDGRTEAEAIAQWEAKNGPLGERDTLVINFTPKNTS